MAQSVKAYTRALWAMQKTVALKLGGVDIRVLPLQLRVVLVLADLSTALVIQALVNAGTVTDAAVQSKLDSTAAADYPALPDDLRAPDPESGYDPPDPDLGA